MQDADALIAVFNKEGKIMGKKLRKDVDKEKDILKTVVILIQNSKDDFLLTKPRVTLWVGKWGSSAAGMVRYGENVEEAAVRTLYRELGLEIPLTKKDESFYNFGGVCRFLSVFHGKSDFILVNKEDATEYRWFSTEEIKKLQCMPTLDAALERYKEQYF